MRSARKTLAAVVLWSSAAAAQQYVISTYAGGALPAPAADGSIGAPISVANDEKGNVYFASPDLNAVFKLDPGGILKRVAGSYKRGYSGDGGPAIAANMNLFYANAGVPSAGLAVDQAGNLFIADTTNQRVRRVSPDGIIITVAGTGVAGFSGDGGPAVDAKLAYPWGVAVDLAGNLFVADAFNHRVRKVSTSGIITTIASIEGMGFSCGPRGNVFVAVPDDAIRHGGISKISTNGAVTTVSSIGGWGIAVDSSGNLFVTDGNARVQKISPDGAVATIAGINKGGYSGDGGPASSAQFAFPLGVAADSKGNLFIADRLNYRVRKISISGVVTTVAGNGTGRLFLDCSSPNYAVAPSSDGPASAAQLAAPWGIAADRDGSLFIADSGNNRILKVSPSGIIATVAGGGSCGGFSGDGGPAFKAQLTSPFGLTVDSAGNLFFIDGYHRIRKISSDGTIHTIAGTGNSGFSGDGGPAASAMLDFNYCNGSCGGLAVDRNGNLFIADSGNNRVRKVSTNGIITTVAGNGNSGSSGDGGRATDAQFGVPTSVAVDSAGNLFIADGDGYIRRVSLDGTIATVAGTGLSSSSSGDGGPASNARLSAPWGLAIDTAGNLFIADPGVNFDGGPGFVDCCSHRIRKISPDGIITTVAGNGTAGFSGDGGPAYIATLNGPVSVAVDGAGNVYVADLSDKTIRLLRPTGRAIVIGAVVDAASQRADPASPGKIVVIYGVGLGPSQLIQNQPKNGQISTELSGTTVSFNNFDAPILYTSATQVAAVVPYAASGASARGSVSYQGQDSADFTVPVAITAPNVFTLNQAGWGQAAGINAADGTVNTAVNPVKIGDYISLYATGEGQTIPAGVDGKLSSTPARPVLPVSVTVGGIPAFVQYAGGAPGQVGGLLQVNVQIPAGVKPGGYVPVVLQVGDASTTPGAVWVAVSGN